MKIMLSCARLREPGQLWQEFCRRAFESSANLSELYHEFIVIFVALTNVMLARAHVRLSAFGTSASVGHSCYRRAKHVDRELEGHDSRCKQQFAK